MYTAMRPHAIELYSIKLFIKSKVTFRDMRVACVESHLISRDFVSVQFPIRPLRVGSTVRDL